MVHTSYGSARLQDDLKTNVIPMDNDAAKIVYALSSLTRVLLCRPAGGLNHLQPGLDHVIMVKMHHTNHQRYPLTLDVVLNCRALALEAANAGYHFYILFDVSTPDTALFQAISPRPQAGIAASTIIMHLPQWTMQNLDYNSSLFIHAA